MEVVAAAPPTTAGDSRSPFHDHDVREWARVDGITGHLEQARLETDSWGASTATTCHRYGKVVDSRALTDSAGSVRQAARRQLEVFQSRVPGGRIQVIRTSASSVSSGRWASSSIVQNGTSTRPTTDDLTNGFDGLQLSLNPLDLTSQKSKASVGRSASRRPPTRTSRPPREPPDIQGGLFRDPHFTAAANLHRVSRLCHQIHETAVRQAFGRSSLSERQSGDGSSSGVEIQEIENSDTASVSSKQHSSLTRTKSTSSDDIHQLDKDLRGGEDLEDLEQLQNWRRTSKIRRSLQFPKQSASVASSKPIDLPENSVSVRKIKEDLEKGRRLNTALRNNSVDLEALDQILQSISSSDKTSTDDNIEDFDEEQNQAKLKQKRDSFVTVESLQEVKCRLRKTNSPSNDIYKNSNNNEETDDGIVTEDNSATPSPSSKVKSYVFGMESLLNKSKPILGTGSLESKSKLVNGTNISRNEDWYNRRKSYGFEQVHNHDDSFSNKRKDFVESSTDSGICRSTSKTNLDDSGSDAELKTNGFDKSFNANGNGLVKKMSSIFDKKSDYSWNGKDVKSTTITIPIVKNNNVVNLSWNDEPERDIKRHSIAVDESKYVTKDTEKFRRTSLAMNDTDDNNRKTKKVEFCKTEVHFAADSGKVNIVETDEKPPPTQNFRRRRRNSGPITNYDDFNRNGLPILHFGDSDYEKNMFGIDDDIENKEEAIYENLTSRVPPAFGTVTITNGNFVEYQEEEKKEENENLKGILKNKPIKPRPYHLGDPIPYTDTSEEETKKWSLRLRPTEKDVPIWKSTVTVRNSFKTPTPNGDENQPEFQKLLRNLRPTRKSDSFSDNEQGATENRHSDSFSNIRIVSPDNRRSSWSVTDKANMEDSIESRGYSTKVNFGNGGATVVENERLPTWPRVENTTKDSKQVLNKRLVVRIGRAGSCSKTTTTQEGNNSATTTTKITIDLSPSPETKPEFKFTKYQRSQDPRFKSTSLILNTIRDRDRIVDRIPQQLEALKKLYDANSEDSDADKEVQLLMSKGDDADVKDDDNSSVVSGSWSKMTAYNNISDAARSSFKKTVAKYDLKYSAKVEKDTTLLKPANELGTQETNNKTTDNVNINLNKSKYSPVGLRKPICATRTELNPPVTHGNASSPLLVSQKKLEILQKSKEEPNVSTELKNVTDTKLQTKHVNEGVVLRQPKKSEMTYFGINVSPKPVKKVTSTRTVNNKKVDPANLSSEKPDLLQHHRRQSSPNNRNNKAVRPPKYSPDLTRRPKSPIYENLKPIKNKYAPAREFDNGILEELTKAADQILQAVNGYTDEENHKRFSTDEEKPKKKLETISETRTWKNKEERKKISTTTEKTKVKRTSSTSSVESISKERNIRNSVEVKPTKTSIERSRKKVVSDSNQTTNKANTRARRLQRASSREALLQSHGSSSEDISTHVEAPVRKPRLIKKTKLTSITMSNGLELKKQPTTTTTTTAVNEVASKDVVHSKVDERICGSLPEIRHKTAVSTIRSTAEKSRERSRHRTDESRRKSSTHKDHLSRGLHSSTRTPPDKSGGTKTTNTTTHKISTANIKRCHRSEGGTKH